MRHETPIDDARVEQMLRDAAIDLPAGEPRPGFVAAALRRGQRRSHWSGIAVRLAAAGVALAAGWFAVRQPSQPPMPARPRAVAAAQSGSRTARTAAAVAPAPTRTDRVTVDQRVVRTDQRSASKHRQKTAIAVVRPGKTPKPSWKSEELPVYEAGMITPAVLAERDDETGRMRFHPALMNIPIETDRQGRLVGVSGTPSVMPVSYSEEAR
jgi:hypothetical protein